MHEYAVGEEVWMVGPYATKDVRGTVQVLPQGERVFYRIRYNGATWRRQPDEIRPIPRRAYVVGNELILEEPQHG